MFRKIRVSFPGPHDKDYTIWGSIFGSPYFEKLQLTLHMKRSFLPYYACSPTTSRIAPLWVIPRPPILNHKRRKHRESYQKVWRGCYLGGSVVRVWSLGFILAIV